MNECRWENGTSFESYIGFRQIEKYYSCECVWCLAGFFFTQLSHCYGYEIRDLRLWRVDQRDIKRNTTTMTVSTARVNKCDFRNVNKQITDSFNKCLNFSGSSLQSLRIFISFKDCTHLHNANTKFGASFGSKAILFFKLNRIFRRILYLKWNEHLPEPKSETIK